MRVLSHPFRLDANGSIVTVEQWSPEQASEVAGAVVSTHLGERSMAPLFGIADPVGVGITAAEARAAVELCEPDLRVDAAVTDTDSSGRQTVRVAVAWRDDEEG